jgi:hypothetical protein
MVSPPPISPRPSDLDLEAEIKSLTEGVRGDLSRPDLIRSNSLNSRSERTGTGESQAATCRLPNQIDFKLESLNQI